MNLNNPTILAETEDFKLKSMTNVIIPTAHLPTSHFPVVINVNKSITLVYVHNIRTLFIEVCVFHKNCTYRVIGEKTRSFICFTVTLQDLCYRYDMNLATCLRGPSYQNSHLICKLTYCVRNRQFVWFSVISCHGVIVWFPLKIK